VSFLGDADGSLGAALGAEVRAAKVEVSARRAVVAARLGVGTLACSRCDAPVALGGEPRALTESLACPFCGHSAPARDFLSLGVSRPARVAVWVSHRRWLR
jgi:hypothetical protein